MDDDTPKPAPIHRSPRALPPEPVEWETEIEPRDQRPSVMRRKPRVILAYQSAKRYTKGRR